MTSKERCDEILRLIDKVIGPVEEVEPEPKRATPASRPSPSSGRGPSSLHPASLLL